MSFHPISMKKSELALLYFPDSTSAVATNRLMRWIYDCPSLMMELETVGYHRSQKLLTSRQVSVSYTHLDVYKRQLLHCTRQNQLRQVEKEVYEM